MVTHKMKKCWNIKLKAVTCLEYVTARKHPHDLYHDICDLNGSESWHFNVDPTLVIHILSHSFFKHISFKDLIFIFHNFAPLFFHQIMQWEWNLLQLYILEKYSIKSLQTPYKVPFAAPLSNVHQNVDFDFCPI